MGSQGPSGRAGLTHSCDYHPISATISVIGGKWKTEIIHALKADGLRFGMLLRRIPRASRKVLTQQLRELQAQNVVSRIAMGKRSERVEYSLTRHGRSLIPVLDVMAEWGKIHLKMSEVEPEPDMECASR